VAPQEVEARWPHRRPTLLAAGGHFAGDFSPPFVLAWRFNDLGARDLMRAARCHPAPLQPDLGGGGAPEQPAATAADSGGTMPKKEPIPPSPDLVAQLQRELTPEVLRHVHMFADRISARLLALEGRDDPGYVPTMVQDAIGDTYAGIRTWDPARRSLRHHLARVIQSRVSHDVQRARRRRHVSFHEVTDSNDENAAAVEMSLRCDDERARPDGRLAVLEGRARVYQGLRDMAGDDAEVIALLDAYQDGHVRRDEVMGRLGWSLPHHVNVRRRLDTLSRRLPADLKATALEILVRDGGPPAPARTRPTLDTSASTAGDESSEAAANGWGDGSLSGDGGGDSGDGHAAAA